VSLIKRLKELGPGALVAAAFVGPGTVTTSTLSGASYGYVLIWALLFATISTIILQEMSARLGLVRQTGLGEALRIQFEDSVFKWPLYGLIIIALYMGNAAYEAGNLAGAAAGVGAIVGPDGNGFDIAVIVLTLLAGGILFKGSYKLIEKLLLTLVFLMALAFIATFVTVGPDIFSLMKGMFVPTIPDGSLLTVIALIGTTIAPYNLFLHASAVKSRWHDKDQLGAVRADTAIAIGMGGLIAILIAATAAASMFAAGLEVQNMGDMAIQFEPLFGSFSRYLIGFGLFAAGLTSTITAPLAIGYVVSEILGWEGGPTNIKFRLVALSVLLIGATISLTGIRPLEVIILAQFANGMLLPIAAGFLLYAMNQRALLGDYVNSWKANIAGGLVLLIAIGLGLRLIARSAGWL